jgi:hypothetical protein
MWYSARINPIVLMKTVALAAFSPRHPHAVMKVRRILALAALLLIPGDCFSEPYVLNLSGTASGSIGSVFFTNAPFAITSIGNTSERQFYFPLGYSIPHVSSSIWINGVGNFELAGSTWTTVNQYVGTVSFGQIGDFNSSNIEGPNSPIFKSWDMLGSIGPVSGPASENYVYLDMVDESLLLETPNLSTASFTATVIPEPRTGLLFLLAFASGAATLFRRAQRESRWKVKF